MPISKKKGKTESKQETQKLESLQKQLDEVNRKIMELRFENDLLKKVKALEEKDKHYGSGLKRTGRSSKGKNNKKR